MTNDKTSNNWAFTSKNRTGIAPDQSFGRRIQYADPQGAGLPQGYYGILRENKFNIPNGVYVPSLPMRRVINTNMISTNGWRILLDPAESGPSYVKNLATGTKVSVENPGFPALPMVEMPWGVDTFVDSYTALAQLQGVQREVKKTLGKKRKIPKAHHEKLLEHRRRGHLFAFDSERFSGLQCPECLLAKGRKRTPRKTRPAWHKKKWALAQLDSDFCGPFPVVSIRGYRYLLVFIDPFSKMPYVFPIRHKSEVVTKSQELIRDLRAKHAATLTDPVVGVIRSDNEPVYRSAEYTGALRALNVQDFHSAPYNPNMNGVAERFIGTLCSGIRAMLVFCDKTLWYYTTKYFITI